MSGKSNLQALPKVLAGRSNVGVTKRVYIHGSEKPDIRVDISGTIDKKIAALKKHVSQVGEWEEMEKVIRDWAAEDGKEHGMEYAESYKVMILVEERPEN
jgi:LmbE family N-acetylglucosaminyl deacetylase